MKPELKGTIQTIALEVVLYGLLVGAYYLLVLHLLGNFLEQTYKDSRQTYAALALGLIIAQGLVLEILTRFLLSWMTPRKEDE